MRTTMVITMTTISTTLMAHHGDDIHNYNNYSDGGYNEEEKVTNAIRIAAPRTNTIS